MDEGPTSAATIALASFGRAAEHGLDPEKYGASTLKTEAARLAGARGRQGASPAELAKFETDLTAALLALGREVAVGRPGQPPAGVGDRRRKSPDIAAHLASLIDEDDLTAWPDDVRPVHPQYAALQQALAASIKEPSGSTNRARLALNLERWRWIPDDLGDRYVLVNIPSYHMWVFENVRPVLDSKVIVGKLGDETPVFSATMTNVVFSPYWNIPESIAEGETVPSVIRNPEYLQKNNIEVLRQSGGAVEKVDPATVNWNNASETSDISLRQRPGPGNALGHIKFLLPNKNNVYLHDTPTHNLFDRRGRAFSHGCVRLEEPVELAKYVLGDEPKWTEAVIRKAMDSGEEQGVKLNRTLPCAHRLLHGMGRAGRHGGVLVRRLRAGSLTLATVAPYFRAAICPLAPACYTVSVSNVSVCTTPTHCRRPVCCDSDGDHCGVIGSRRRGIKGSGGHQSRFRLDWQL